MRPCRRGRRCPKSRTNERQDKASQATNPHTATRGPLREVATEHCEDLTGTRPKRPCPLPPRPSDRGTGGAIRSDYRSGLNPTAGAPGGDRQTHPKRSETGGRRRRRRCPGTNADCDASCHTKRMRDAARAEEMPRVGVGCKPADQAGGDRRKARDRGDRVGQPDRSPCAGAAAPNAGSCSTISSAPTQRGHADRPAGSASGDAVTAPLLRLIADRRPLARYRTPTLGRCYATGSGRSKQWLTGRSDQRP
jgi:hypothetical protein